MQNVVFVACSLLLFLSHAVPWDSRNNPLTFSLPTETGGTSLCQASRQMEFNFSKLPLSAEIDHVPWSDTYWPNYQGGLAYRWHSDDPKGFDYHLYTRHELLNMPYDKLAALSPAEKFDIYQNRFDYPTVASEWNRTNADMDEWMGLCHGWALAAIYYHEPAPVNWTTSGGIVIPFGSADIKALLSFYAAEHSELAGTTFVGKRCNFRVDEDSAVDVCHDVNAGSFHTLLGNMVGLRKMSFVFDRDAGHEVWNQPIVSYESKVVDRIRISPSGDIISDLHPPTQPSIQPEEEEIDLDIHPSINPDEGVDEEMEHGLRDTSIDTDDAEDTPSGGWVLLLAQDVSSGSPFFTPSTRFTLLQNENNPNALPYSSIGNYDFSALNSPYRFKLRWGGVQSSSEFEWTQTSALNHRNVHPTGYVCISGDCPDTGFQGSGFNGLAFSDSSVCLFDGDGYSHPNWFNCAGSMMPFDGGIPGPNAQIATSVHLYIYEDTPSHAHSSSRGRSLLSESDQGSMFSETYIPGMTVLSVETSVGFTVETYPQWEKHEDDVVRELVFRYTVELDDEGHIIGGSYAEDSAHRPDFIWFAPLPDFFGYFEALGPLYDRSVSNKGWALDAGECTPADTLSHNHHYLTGLRDTISMHNYADVTSYSWSITPPMPGSVLPNGDEPFYRLCTGECKGAMCVYLKLKDLRMGLASDVLRVYEGAECDGPLVVNTAALNETRGALVQGTSACVVLVAGPRDFHEGATPQREEIVFEIEYEAVTPCNY